MKILKEILSLLTVLGLVLFCAIGTSTLLVVYIPIWISLPAIIGVNAFFAYLAIDILERMS